MENPDHFSGVIRYVGGRDTSASTSSSSKTDEDADEVRVYLPTRIVIADINR